MKERVLIGGIGNIFLGDHAFGVEVVRKLAGRFPSSVRVADFGIRGFDLAYALMDGYQFSILVDVIPRGGSPGTLYTIGPELPVRTALEPQEFQGHGLTLAHVLELVQTYGGSLPRLLIVGCEPTPLVEEAEESGWMGLSPPVQAAVPEAVALIESAVTEFLARADSESTPALAFSTASER